MRTLPFLLVLAACGPQPQPPEAKSQPVPPILCEKARDGLDKLRAKGAIDYDRAGAATIPQDAWMAMGTGGHGQLAQMLALHAACADPGGPPERPIVIRNESGVILMETSVSTDVGLGSLEDE